MDSHFTNLPLLEKLHEMIFYFTCSISKNRKGLPNGDENGAMEINEIKAYRSGNILLQKFRNKILFVTISYYFEHRTKVTEEKCKQNAFIKTITLMKIIILKINIQTK